MCEIEIEMELFDQEPKYNKQAHYQESIAYRIQIDVTITYFLIIKIIIHLRLKEGSRRNYRNYTSYTVHRNLSTKKLSP